MKICTLLVTAFLCFQTTQTIAEKDKMRGCRSSKCKFKLNSRLRLLRDMSKAFFPGKNLVDVTLKSLHDRQEGTFGEFNTEESNGYDIPKLGKRVLSLLMLSSLFSQKTVGKYTIYVVSFRIQQFKPVTLPLLKLMIKL